MRSHWLFRKALLILCACVLCCCSQKQPDKKDAANTPGKQETEKPIPVEIACPHRQRMDAYILTTTTLKADREVEILAKVSGQVMEILKDEADKVKAGEVIAKLDDREARLTVDDARVRLNNAQKLFERSEKMYKQGVISREAYDSSKLQYETAKVDLQQAQITLEYHTILAPIDGVIVTRDVDKGDYVRVGERMFTIVDTDPLIAEVYIPEQSISLVTIGKDAEIRADASPDQTFHAKATRLCPVIDPNSGTRKVRIEIHDKTSTLRPGMFVSVRIITKPNPNALVIPKKALLLDTEADEVFVVEDVAEFEAPTEKLKELDVGDEVVLRAQLEYKVEPDKKENTEGMPTAHKAAAKEHSKAGDKKPPKPASLEAGLLKVASSQQAKGAEAGSEEAATAEPQFHQEQGEFKGKIKAVPEIHQNDQAPGAKPPEKLSVVVVLEKAPDKKPDRATASIEVLKNGEKKLELKDAPVRFVQRSYKRRLKLGFSEGNDVEVVEGLKDTDRVVVMGQDDLRQGSLVQIVNMPLLDNSEKAKEEKSKNDKMKNEKAKGEEAKTP